MPAIPAVPGVMPGPVMPGVIPPMCKAQVLKVLKYDDVFKKPTKNKKSTKKVSKVFVFSFRKIHGDLGTS